MHTPKQEYPRMQLRRDLWQNLNGEWDFEFDDQNVGTSEKWYQKDHLEKKIIVPFAYQTKLSQIYDTTTHERVWYMKKFSLPAHFQHQRIRLHFGAVDYQCTVYLNDEMVYQHIGGHVGFSVDITPNLKDTNKLVVSVFDPSTDETIPRGKQFWQTESRDIWYTKTTGIWQTVWLEPVPDVFIQHLKLTPDIDCGRIHIEARLNETVENASLETTITLKNTLVQSCTHRIDGNYIQFSLDVFKKEIFRTSFHNDGNCWTPENPTLFDITFHLTKGSMEDTVYSYFGMRKIHTDNGLVYLNNKPYYQKLVLDQGYWPDSLLTAPTDEALVADIMAAKEMGFNGCRKHQKVEEERFLYWADRLGFLVWGELPSGISFDDQYVERITNEWIQVVKRDYNHPSIVTWVPLNESWGIPHVGRQTDQQAHSVAMYYLTKSIDPTRLVISNDGWEMTVTDICAIHNYNHGNLDEVEKRQYFETCLQTKENMLADMPSGRPIYCTGFENQNAPLILSEFGGIAFDEKNTKNWGYTRVKSTDVFYSEYQRLMHCISNSGCIVGFCYTQLTDVEFEVNGLLTYDRKMKFDPKKLYELNHIFTNVTKKKQ